MVITGVSGSMLKQGLLLLMPMLVIKSGMTNMFCAI